MNTRIVQYNRDSQPGGLERIAGGDASLFVLSAHLSKHSMCLDLGYSRGMQLIYFLDLGGSWREKFGKPWHIKYLI